MNPRRLTRTLLVLSGVCVSLLWFRPADAVPIGGVGTTGAAPGVFVDADGTVKRRVLDEKTEMTAMRARAKAAADAAKDPKPGFVSLSKALAAAKDAQAAGKAVPNDARYLGGLTRIDFIFAFPEEHDLVISGPAEQVIEQDEFHAIGVRTGRPVMRLEDFVVAMRIVSKNRGGTFGCRLDPDPAAAQRMVDVMAKYATASRAERTKAIQEAVGPQKVSFFGKIPDDSRFALATIAADYELKRYALGLARSTVPGLGTGTDSSRQAANMWWYELAYEPLLVSQDGNSYGLRGPRLKVQAGGFDWDKRGATPHAMEFVKKLSANIETLATIQPLIADLQNLADLSVLATIIQRDRIDRKIGWDIGYVMKESGDASESFQVAKAVVPKTAVGLAAYSNGAIAAGGVVLTPAGVIGEPEKDASGKLDVVRKSAVAAAAARGK